MFKFKEPYDCIDLEIHTDKRGVLFEIMRFKDQNIPGKGYFYTFSVNPGARRGDHYHKRKKEWFACIYGEAVVLIEDKKGNKEKIKLTSSKPKLLYFGPYTAHTVLNESDGVAVLVSYGSKQHNPKDEDTFKKFIEI
jgi:dTDP-4-dehydrorhamnose 3,5-epimerase-like enzyme